MNAEDRIYWLEIIEFLHWKSRSHYHFGLFSACNTKHKIALFLSNWHSTSNFYWKTVFREYKNSLYVTLCWNKKGGFNISQTFFRTTLTFVKGSCLPNRNRKRKLDDLCDIDILQFTTSVILICQNPINFSKLSSNMIIKLRTDLSYL